MRCVRTTGEDNKTITVVTYFVQLPFCFWFSDLFLCRLFHAARRFSLNVRFRTRGFFFGFSQGFLSWFVMIVFLVHAARRFSLNVRFRTRGFFFGFSQGFLSWFVMIVFLVRKAA